MKQFLTILAVSIYAIIIGLGIGKLPWAVLGGFAFLPFLFLRIGSRSLFLLLPIIFLNSSLFVPGIPGNFSLYQLLCLISVFYIIITGAILKRETLHKFSSEVIISSLILIWVILLMYFRGTGMRVFGSTDIGGATYLQIIITFLFYILTFNEHSKPSALKWTGVLLGLLCFLPLIAQGLYELTGGAIWHQMLFFKFGAAQGETTQQISQGNMSRLSFLSHGAMLIWAGFFLGTKKNNTLWLRWLFCLIALMLALLGGYRATALSTVTFLYIYTYLSINRKWLFLGLTLCAALISYPILMMVIEHLPFAIQRILSSFPGMHVSHEAKQHALGTLLWRQEVWSLAWNDYPKYWFLGRGVTFDPAMIPLQDLYFNTPYVAVSIGAFHQATLELLILFGTPAFILCVSFYALAIRRGIKTFTQKTWYDPDLENWGKAFLIYIIVSTVLAFSGGTSGDLLIQLPIWIVMFNLIRNSDINLRISHENRYNSTELE